jgi:catechol 2,3-dioxygenase-like lactoylglutathione lyase family enzyme
MPRLVGINHVALEVGDLEEAIRFYGEIFELGTVAREPGMAFLDMGDQFLALSEGPTAGPDQLRHFGLVVDDKQAVRDVLEARGVEILPGRFLDFLDPWGNRIQVIDYREIQFVKLPSVLRAMGLNALVKHEGALRELTARGFV